MQDTEKTMYEMNFNGICVHVELPEKTKKFLDAPKTKCIAANTPVDMSTLVSYIDRQKNAPSYYRN
jgi:hypothetical protein